MAQEPKYFLPTSREKNLGVVYMTGGLMQLVAYGAQDIYLTGNPMITYFKVVYRRHTNFAMESIEQVFTGNVGFGNKVTSLISRNGDLISGLCLEATLPALVTGTRWTDDIGHHLISEVNVEIGGQQIDKHYGDWLEIWAQLTVPASQLIGYRDMIGQKPKDALGRPMGLQRVDGAKAATKVYVPLQFWFCRNVGLALPLIALQYHEVKVNITFRAESALTHVAGGGAGTASTDTLSASLWADYIYLDTDERRRFAQVSHEYLIEQLQVNDKTFSSAGSTTVDLTFNHPVKELVWVTKYNNVADDGQHSNYTQTLAVAKALTADITGLTTLALVEAETRLQDYTCPASVAAVLAVNPTTDAKLKLNGHDRFALRQGRYFNQYQTKHHHTCVPKSPGINVYSFALKPEDHQPSGTCNFSRIDNAQLFITVAAGEAGVGNAGTIRVFAVNYNVLRIMSGMGGLAYSN
jgi:hypothetical protein